MGGGVELNTHQIKNKLDPFALILTVLLVFSLIFTACDNGGTGDIAVTLSSVTANGSATQTTTTLMLTFSAAISGLTADDITLSGVNDVAKGSLSGNNPYTLPISGFTGSGSLIVEVAKSGYEISGSPKTGIAIYYYSGKTLDSISVTEPPEKTEYTVGETLSLSGMVVTATYSDSTTQAVIGYTTTPADGFTLNTTGSLTVTISYTEGEVTKTATTSVTVTSASKTLSSIAITTQPIKTTYTIGETLSLSGMVVTATYSDSTTQAVPGYTASPANGTALSTLGGVTVTISYTESGVTKTATTSVTVIMPDAIPLTLSNWEDGNIPSVGGKQWFSFKATATSHYIHFDNSGSLKYVYVQLYDSSGATVGSQTELYGVSTSGNSRTQRTGLVSGQTYYIRVWPRNSSDSGTYKIGFSRSQSEMNPLNFNTWADGDIPNAGGEQWFSFEATATSHYIHFDNSGSLKYVYVQLYDSSNATVGSQTELWGASTSANSRTQRTGLASGQTYYLRVWTRYISESGTYKIAFNSSTTRP